MFNFRFFHDIHLSYLLFAIVIGAVGLCAGCKTLAIKNDTGVVVAKRAQIRSSTAVVAADLLEVNRGDTVVVLDSTTVLETGEKWLLVRAKDEQNTEGWIEARNILPQTILAQTKQLADQDKDIPSQATGQLRASTNLRMTPDRTGDENIILKLESGSNFDIVGWKRVPKPKSSETTESDDQPKAGQSQQGNRNKRESADIPKEPEESNELWYRVRLQPAVSPAPAGWVYGKQVELTVPSDIIFYRTGREFVAWQRLDEDSGSSQQQQAPGGKSGGGETKPGSWVILEKSNTSDPKKGDEPDFDRIYVLGYDKASQEHYTAFRSPDLKGYLPLRVENKGDSKSFSINVQDSSGKIVEAKYNVRRDDKGNLRVSSASEQQREKKKR
jgi:hypothetical protein